LPARQLGEGDRLVDSAAFNAREIEDGSGTARLLAFADALQPGSTATQQTRQPAWTAPVA
jgi:hypothetical protein